MSPQLRCPIRLNFRLNVCLFLTIVLLFCAALIKMTQISVPSYVSAWSIGPFHTSNNFVADDLIKRSLALLVRSKELLQQLDTVLATSKPVQPGQLRSNLEKSHTLQKELDVFIKQYALRLNQSTAVEVVQPTREPEGKDVQPAREPEGGLQLQCNNVLGQMLNGHWQQRVTTSQEEATMKQFHLAVNKEQGIASNLQRPDRKCGNVTQGAFRALCDPYGPTPCCYGNSCTLKSQEECACPDCFDMRPRIYAEFATWSPGDPSCKVHNFSSEQMCQLLDNSTLYFVGDSYVRHLYTAFLMFARNDELEGALRNDTPPDIRKQCQGMYMFTEKTCRLHLDNEVTLCDGRVTTKNFYLVNTALATQIHTTIDKIENQTRSFLILGFGIHDRFNTGAIQTRLLLPVLQKRKNLNMTWPKLVWATSHAPGFLKDVFTYPEQSFQGVSSYNSQMIQFLLPWKVPIFDTYNMTLGLRSFDGNHYGLGANKMKVMILLNYILELSVKKMW